MVKPESPTELLDAMPSDRLALVERLRSVVLQGLPEAAEVVRAGWLFFESRGPVCFIQPHSQHVNLGFWRGAHLPDPDRVLEGTGRHPRHIQIRSRAAIDLRATSALVEAASKLNRESPYTSQANPRRAGAAGVATFEIDRSG
jgi:hypothetical protein